MNFAYLSTLSSLILAISVLAGVMLAYLVAIRILRQQQAVQNSLQSIQQKEFFSDQDEWKVSLERQIADLNRRLIDSAEEFRKVNHLLYDAESGSGEISRTAQTNSIKSKFLDDLKVGVVSPRSDLVFVLTPFETREVTTYAAIVEAFQPWGIEVLRGDEVRVKSNLLGHVVELIASSTIVIANVSTRNPNVMYELGIAHALGKQVLMVSKTIEAVPFDLRNQRILLYSDRKDLIAKLRESAGRLLFTRYENS